MILGGSQTKCEAVERTSARTCAADYLLTGVPIKIRYAKKQIPYRWLTYSVYPVPTEDRSLIIIKDDAMLRISHRPGMSVRRC